MNTNLTIKLTANFDESEKVNTILESYKTNSTFLIEEIGI